MKLHAFLRDNVVVEVRSITDEQYVDHIKNYQMIIDVDNLLISPQVGWILVGNILSPPPGQAVDLKTMIKAKIKSYQEQAPELLRDMYAENTLLGITTTQSDQMFADYQDVLIRIREGAWPTALHALNQKQPSGFVTQEMIDSWKAMLMARMV
jgi:hypothetical protein